MGAEYIGLNCLCRALDNQLHADGRRQVNNCIGFAGKAIQHQCVIQIIDGLIGLAVMGQNLVLNLERNGYTVAVYNRTTATTRGICRRSAPAKNWCRPPSLASLSPAWSDRGAS